MSNDQTSIPSTKHSPSLNPSLTPNLSLLGYHEDIDLTEIGRDLQKFSSNELVREALIQGINLSSYSHSLHGQLSTLEDSLVSDVIASAPDLIDIHQHIKECDGILEKMENTLGVFQDRLGTISHDIKNLQEDSLKMSVQLRNRKSVDAKISKFIDSLSISPAMIKLISDGEIDEKYQEALVNISTKLQFLYQTSLSNSYPLSPSSPSSHSSNQVNQCPFPSLVEEMPLIEKLKNKAINRVVIFLTSRFEGFLKPQTNVSIKQKSLLKYKYLPEWLAEIDPKSLHKVRSQYIQNMNKMYYQQFKNYCIQLQKYVKNKALSTQNYLSNMKFSGFFSSPPSSIFNQFILGKRHLILSRQQINKKECIYLKYHSFIIYHYDDLLPLSSVFTILNFLNNDAGKDPYIIPLIHNQNPNFEYEDFYESVLHLLVDTCSQEYVFVHSFFLSSPLFVSIFAKTFSYFLTLIEDYLFTSYDLISIAIMIMITNKYHQVLHQRNINLADTFFERLSSILSSAQHKLLEEASTICSQYHLSLSSDAYYPLSLTIAIGYILLSFSTISADTLPSSLQTLSQNLFNTLQRLAGHISSPQTQITFLLNNLDALLLLLPPSSSLYLYYEPLYNHNLSLYVENILSDHYSTMLQFIKKYENISSLNFSTEYDEITKHIHLVIDDFNQHWKTDLELIHQKVQKAFTYPNPQQASSSSLSQNISTSPSPSLSLISSNMVYRGQNIFQQTLTQLILYYNRFREIIPKVIKISLSQSKSNQDNIQNQTLDKQSDSVVNISDAAVNQISSELLQSLLPLQTLLYTVKQHVVTGLNSNISSQ